MKTTLKHRTTIGRPRVFRVVVSLQVDRGPVAQLIEHRVALGEVESSTPAGPTLRVLK